MAIMIREYVDASFAENADNYDGSLNVTEALHNNTAVNTIDPNSLMVEIEGIHAAPFATRNYTRYTAKCLKNSVSSWVEPYNRPMIKHHNEENGDIIGRVVAAEYVKNNTLSGTPALKFTVNIPGEQAKQDVKNGLLATTSIGVIAHDVRCSVCGKPILDAEHGCEEGHKRGVTYQTDEGPKTCYWDIHDMEGKEISFVVVPSDMYAQQTNIYPAATQSSNQPQIKESLDNSINEKGEQNMADTNKPTELEEAKAKVSELETKVTELTEANKASESKVAELTESKTALEAKITELTESNTALEAAAAESKQLKESMEQDIADTKAQLKESVVDTFVTLREALGRKVSDVDSIKNRSVDSLKDSIMDMKESLTSKDAGTLDMKENLNENKTEDISGKANSVSDPTLGKADDGVNVTESVDLKSGLKNIFSSVMSARA